jgi:hypothetical protein
MKQKGKQRALGGEGKKPARESIRAIGNEAFGEDYPL